jgi:DNA-binding CsgD family transcriptional regulator
MENGLGGWMYHHLLRRRLASSGLLPGDLPEFLSFCAGPRRGWLRTTNAYEFRHRELLDHLAPAESINPMDACPLSHDELDLLRRLAHGKSHEQIAAELHLPGSSAVWSRCYDIRTKLGWMTENEAVEVAAYRGWL